MIKIIHQSFQNIAQPLVTIINTSLSAGVFPESLQIAKVIPVLRQMTQHFFLATAGQYQFFQPFLNSLKKSCTAYWLINFLNLHNILYSKQFGFRNNHWTALAFVDLINNISSAIDRKETTLGIFLDLSRTFDAINHEILCQKLQHYGIWDTALVWIKSCLEDQTQFVQFGSHRSYRFYVASHRAQFLDLFCLLFTLMIFLICL